MSQHHDDSDDEYAISVSESQQRTENMYALIKAFIGPIPPPTVPPAAAATITATTAAATIPQPAPTLKLDEAVPPIVPPIRLLWASQNPPRSVPISVSSAASNATREAFVDCSDSTSAILQSSIASGQVERFTQLVESDIVKTLPSFVDVVTTALRDPTHVPDANAIELRRQCIWSWLRRGHPFPLHSQDDATQAHPFYSKGINRLPKNLHSDWIQLWLDLCIPVQRHIKIPDLYSYFRTNTLSKDAFRLLVLHGLDIGASAPEPWSEPVSIRQLVALGRAPCDNEESLLIDRLSYFDHPIDVEIMLESILLPELAQLCFEYLFLSMYTIDS